MIARRGDLRINPSTPVEKLSLLHLTSKDELCFKCIPTRSERELKVVLCGVPLDLEAADISTELSSYGVFEVKRSSKWDDSSTNQIPTGTVALKFSSLGSR